MRYARLLLDDGLDGVFSVDSSSRTYSEVESENSHVGNFTWVETLNLIKLTFVPFGRSTDYLKPSCFFLLNSFLNVISTLLTILEA